ncbi:amphoterin-induced protein 3 [Poecilia latipinna]|uniref:amphoterin-induced protein 3 n=1 Tax=Poecilia latipinna TaxID=48699 RepID=UPI00072E4EDB|nr:PREDICTED: amphoterin-induced protein 3-like [Poecilia latipinna]XP_014900167.1 PREDICTED: amphoterin-induced protein 3-like [Poecilia latipinna]XP_014900168.1 PREDICTED: amphoterin-induced protein 3-like [Poecilia latipinna]
MTSEHFHVLFLLLFCVLHSSEQTCPSKCLCMSDTVRCSSVGLHKPPQSLPSFPANLDLSHNHITWLDPNTLTMMPRLEKLWMAHNEIRTLSHNLFRNVSGLRLLDLSSNRLQMVEQHYFHGLWRLEELRLFNNRITQVEDSSLSGLSSLKKVYFSFNQITHFPFFSIQDHTHPFLAMLDLSSNRMSSLPLDDVKALPQLVQQGLYTHNNSLICNCSMYAMFWHWNLREYNSIKDFTDEHTCNVDGDLQRPIRFFRDKRFFRNCTVERTVTEPVTVLLSDVVVFEGDRVRLDCQTSLSSTNLSFTWLSPSRGFITQSSMDDTLISMFPDGTLEIHATTISDSGMYLCTAVDIKQALNGTREVNVTVLLPAAEPFNTGYTTLIGCMVTLVLILAYLFLTPCRCSFCKQPPAHSNQGTLSCILSSFTREQPNIDTLKHVAFREHPIGEERIEWIPQS